MKPADTISVNPGKNTLGHVEVPVGLFRQQVLQSEIGVKSLDLVKVLFPTAGSGTSEYRKYDIALRTLFATILIVSGLTMLGGASAGIAVGSLCFGAFLALGLFTRPVMAGAAIFYCIMGALSLRSGAADISVFSLMFGCLVFCVIGAGKYSIDTLLRSYIIRSRKTRKSRSSENYLGYKAFHKVF